MIGTRQRGFTLIELVVVITILGILAAFAIPRFITLDTAARTATVNALAGSVKSAAALARSMAMAGGLAANASVTMEGQTVTQSNFYPTADALGINVAIPTNAGDFAVAYAGTTATWTRANAPTPAACTVAYTAATAAVPPAVVVTLGGC